MLLFLRRLSQTGGQAELHRMLSMARLAFDDAALAGVQDDMERYAIGASSLYVKLRRPSDVMPYNQALS